MVTGKGLVVFRTSDLEYKPRRKTLSQAYHRQSPIALLPSNGKLAQRAGAGTRSNECSTGNTTLLQLHFLKLMEVRSDEEVPVPPEPTTFDILKALFSPKGRGVPIETLG
ncbi:S-adenosyl-L-methionine-dependentmethyltransferases superfamily protein [Striga asiatica]|uniref:S-adenosyl-L-methionine-dependentmethyltransferases superfamily protein n=1 Tax=Striga asiatica TaxID=4170 RepID=A0A5A7Q1X9_STRAF|nr:S-adenosyl-L-methionine-dependentmethyltransferases superfamily protein [Striga asiatica]